MDKNPATIFFVLLMIAVIVAVDVVFFRHKLVARLLSNVGIVLIFIAFYLAFLKH